MPPEYDKRYNERKHRRDHIAPGEVLSERHSDPRKSSVGNEKENRSHPEHSVIFKVHHKYRLKKKKNMEKNADDGVSEYRYGYLALCESPLYPKNAR